MLQRKVFPCLRKWDYMEELAVDGVNYTARVLVNLELESKLKMQNIWGAAAAISY